MKAKLFKSLGTNKKFLWNQENETIKNKSL